MLANQSFRALLSPVLSLVACARHMNKLKCTTHGSRQPCVVQFSSLLSHGMGPMTATFKWLALTLQQGDNVFSSASKQDLSNWLYSCSLSGTEYGTAPAQLELVPPPPPPPPPSLRMECMEANFG